MGITIATGGAAAVVAGAAAGGSVFAVQRTAHHMEQEDRDIRAASGDLVLAVRTPTDAKHNKAEAILRDMRATGIAVVR